MANVIEQSKIDQFLADMLKKYDAQAGMVHVLEKEKNQISLVAYTPDFYPPNFVRGTKVVPLGKGIAGNVAKDGKPCVADNLRDMPPPTAIEKSRHLGLLGMVVVPIYRHPDTQDVKDIVGTIGIGCSTARQFTEAEIKDLTETSSKLVGNILGKPEPLKEKS